MKTYLISILLVALLVACQPATPMPTPQTQDTGTAKFVVNPPVETKTENTPIPTPSDSKQIVPETKTFNVEAFQFSYEPNVIHVKVGDKVHIHLTTRDVSHSFNIRELKVSISAAPGVPGDGEFLVEKAGTFRWQCSIPCGSGHKTMSGTLIVE